MTYTIEILNPANESVETLSVPYQAFVMVTDHTGRHSEPETLGEFIYNLGGLASQEILDRPGHTAILYGPAGIPLAVYNEE